MPVELFPFAYVFRAGSQLRITIDSRRTRPFWRFDSVDGEDVVNRTPTPRAGRPPSPFPWSRASAPLPRRSPGPARQPCTDYQAVENQPAEE